MTSSSSTRQDEETHLEDVKRFKLHVLTLATQQIHDRLEIRVLRNEPRHDTEIRPIEQDLAEQFERLPLGDVVPREHEWQKGREKLCGVNTDEDGEVEKCTLS